MDGAQVLREVRRRQGWTQRQLAASSGVAVSTIAAVEAARRSPSLAVLTAVLAAAGLELAIDVPPAQPAPEVVRHLRLSTAGRLHRGLGGDGRPAAHRQPAAWRQLGLGARAAQMHLHGDLARSVWLPTTPGRLVVCARWWVPGAAEAVPAQMPLLTVLPPCGTHVAAPVRVVLGHHQVLVDPPGDLSLREDQAEHRAALRSVARLLHEDSPRDAAGRRPRAHRDPDHRAEHEHVFHTKRFAHLPLPDRADVRSWRLDDSAGKDEWLRRLGYPT